MSYLLDYKIFLILIALCTVPIMHAQGITTKLAGQYTVDFATAVNMNALNSRIVDDCIWYTRSTLDCSFDAMWGEKDCPWIHFYDQVRFRYVWGSSTETHSFDVPVMIAQSPHIV